MVIAVVSDTHRMDRYIQLAKEKLIGVDTLIYLGDNVDDVKELSKGFKGNVYAVLGNCDYSNEYPEERIINLMGYKILITHGHLYNVKYGLNNYYYRAKEIGADIALFGHTHQEVIAYEDGILFMNPGSPSLPRGSGRYIGIIELSEDKKPKAYLETIE